MARSLSCSTSHSAHSWRTRRATRAAAAVVAQPPAAGAAIVSTVKGVEKTVCSWIRWHAAQGFHLFLYFDAPAADEASIAIASRFACVTIVRTDTAFWKRESYASLPSWPQVADVAVSQVQARQRLNCEHCVRSIAAGTLGPRGIRWLLHIDSDELFRPPAAGAADHFAQLDRDGVWQYTYGNVEAVPQELDAADPFRSIAHFRQHDDWLGPETRARGSPAHAAYLFWLSRSNRLLGEPLYFLFYMNGKSAIRVGTAGLLCGGVHGWRAHAPPSGWRTNLPSLAQRERISLCRSHAAPHAERPAILHYACCSLSQFAAKNWPALGYLDLSGRFGRGTAADESPHIHRWHGLQGTTKGTGLGGEAPQRALRDDYCSLVALLDADETRRQLEAGVLVRIDGPSTLLNNPF